MKKHKIRKRLTAAAVSAAVLLSAAASPLCSIEAYDSNSKADVRFLNTFDDGVILPWKLWEREPSSAKMCVDEGSVNIIIVSNDSSNGYGMHDLGLIRTGLTFYMDQTYLLHAEITADHDGEIFTAISGNETELWHNSMGATDNSSGYERTDSIDQSWDRLPVKAGETLVIDAMFEVDADYSDGAWGFYFGGAGQYNETECFPEGTTIQIDNVMLYNAKDKPPAPSNGSKNGQEMPFAVNQIGYLPYSDKKAVLFSDEPITEDDFFVMDAYSDLPVYRNYLLDYSVGPDPVSGKYTAIADFSKLQGEGEYYLSFRGTQHDSYTFKISDYAYEGVLSNAVNFFYQCRSGMPISCDYITSKGNNESKENLEHGAFPGTEDVGYIQNQWISSYSGNEEEIQTDIGTVEAKGGWLEPENCAKSVINGATSAWMLMNLYERAANYGEASRFNRTNCEIITPEEYDRVPDILNEVKYELEFLRSMKVPEDLKYSFEPYDGFPGDDTGEYAGMLFHQIQYSSYVSPSEAPTAAEDNAQIKRIVKPPTTAATLAAAAVFAQASRLFGEFDQGYAETLLNEAVSAYNAAKNNPSLYAPYEDAVSSVTTIDSCVDDEFYWAACELFATTGLDVYRTDLERYEEYAYRLTQTIPGSDGESELSTAFNSFCTAAYGNLSLALNTYLLATSDYQTLFNSIENTAYMFLTYEEDCPFGVPYLSKEYVGTSDFGDETKLYDYENKSNGIILNNAIVLAYAYDITGYTGFRFASLRALDYIFGCNPLELSYVTGYGKNCAEHPVHYFFGNSSVSAPKGILVSGPNSALNDPYVQGLGMKNGVTPPQCSYADSAEAWSVNASDLDLNASLAWMMSFFSIGDVSTSFYNEYYSVGGSPNFFRGDITLDCRISIADAMYLIKYFENSMSFFEEQYRAADMNNDGVLNAIDLTLLKRILVNCNATNRNYYDPYF